jgi:hypothetical protein
MVRDAQDAVGDEFQPAPRMLRQPADAAPPLGHVATSAPLVSLRRVRSDQLNGARRSLRGWAGRISGRSDRRLLLALVESTEAITTQLDLLTDRLMSQEAMTADITDAFGQELARLRAELTHVRRSVAAPREPGS